MISDETRSGLGLIGSAAALGGIHDLLFESAPLGLNVLLAALFDCAVLVFLVRWRGERLPRITIWGVAVVLLFASCILARDSPVLVAFDLMAIVAAVAAAILTTNRVQLGTAGVTDYLRGFLLTLDALLLGAPLGAARDVIWKDLSGSSWTGRLGIVLRGAVIAVPILLILGGLLVSADQVYGRMMADLFNDDLAALGRHLMVAGFFAWGLAGILSAIIKRRRVAEPGESSPLSLGSAECAIILGAVDLLFVTFVIVQIRYLFGGADLVATGAGLTYAEYARHGFFELVAVAAVELPLLLAIDWLMRNRKRTRTVTILAALQIVLLFVIMASALQRMDIYREEYGQTELRFYVTAFIWWMGFLFLWFGATVLRGRRRYFAAGAAISAFVSLLLLNVLNPDAMIAGMNCDRIGEGKSLDSYYLTSLSADAVPLLVDRLRMLDQHDREMISAALIRRWRIGRRNDGIGFNVGRFRAQAAVDGRLGEILGYMPHPKPEVEGFPAIPSAIPGH